MKKFTSKCVVTSLLIGSAICNARGDLVGPAYPAPGGNTFGSTGNNETAAGANWTYGGFNPTAFTQLYWAPVTVASGLNGTLSDMTFQSIIGDQATWTGTTSYGDTDPGNPATGNYDTLLTVTIAGLGATPWVTGSSLGDPGVPALVNATAASTFTANISFEVSDASTYVGLNSFHNYPGDTVASFGGGFYTPVPEPTTMISGAFMLLPFGASTLRTLRRKRMA